MSYFDEQQAKLNLILQDKEAMADPIVGPCMRQIARVQVVRGKAMVLDTKFSTALGGVDDITPDEAREMCEESRALAVELAGAYGALSRLLPAMIKHLKDV